ncbi:MAG: thermonuclease family protein [Cyanobacteria bacterium P01_G01_bin.67]
MNLIKLLAVLCLILLISCSAQPDRENLLAAKVTRVVSGQTVEVRLTGATEITKVRITGIDAPDLRQDPWGKTAKEKLSELVMGLPILLESELDRDRFNRLNAHVWQDQNLISQQLVESGCVLVNDRYDHRYSKLLMESQEYARLMGYGIWNPRQAMRHTPNQFRSLNKK